MPSVPLRPTTIRFASDALEMVNKAAEEMGVSSAQFIREAAIMRAILCMGDSDQGLKALSEQVKHLARRDD